MLDFKLPGKSRVTHNKDYGERNSHGTLFHHPTSADYLTYLNAVRAALLSISTSFELRGPAGLFHPNNDSHHNHHPLCWGLLQYCNAATNITTTCPIQTITYHRKGVDGTAASILRPTFELIATLRERFPRLMQHIDANGNALRYANSEADPTSGWSHPLPGNANVEYAGVLVENVLLHWAAYRRDAGAGGALPRLAGLSHDNAFLSYHPYEFEQRTLLAHFQMNETGAPPDVQFFAKPVYAALGMMALTLGPAMSPVRRRFGRADDEPQCVWVVSKNRRWDDHRRSSGWYASVLLVSSGSNVSRSLAEQAAAGRDHIRLRISATAAAFDDKECWWIAEYLEQNTTDPHHIWLSHGAPAYPDVRLRQRMRRAQVRDI